MDIKELKKTLNELKVHLDNIIAEVEKHEKIDNSEDEEIVNDNLDFMQSVMEVWNKELKAECKLTKSVIRSFNARLKDSYSKDEILRAVKNRISFVNRSKWHNDPDNRVHKINIALVLRNDQDMQKYLNIYSQQELFEVKESTIGMKKEVDSNLLD